MRKQLAGSSGAGRANRPLSIRDENHHGTGAGQPICLEFTQADSWAMFTIEQAIELQDALWEVIQHAQSMEAEKTAQNASDQASEQPERPF